MGFWERAQEDPGWLAVVEPDGTEHTAGDLLGRVNQLVHALRARGLRAGDGITALVPNGIAPVELYLAALQAGWYYTPINWHLAGPEIAYIVRDSEAKAFFVHERFAQTGRAAADEAGLPARARFALRRRPGLPAGRRAARGPARHAAARTAPRARPCTTRPARPAGQGRAGAR